VFSAFLKCPTKAYLVATGELVPDTYFAEIEAHTLYMYKAVTKRRLSNRTETTKLLDWGSAVGHP